MSSESAHYQKYIEQLGLTEEQGKELIGALQCIVESLLNKKYMLEYNHELKNH
jgi:hypothetical protein